MQSPERIMYGIDKSSGSPWNHGVQNRYEVNARPQPQETRLPGDAVTLEQGASDPQFPSRNEISRVKAGFSQQVPRRSHNDQWRNDGLSVHASATSMGGSLSRAATSVVTDGMSSQNRLREIACHALAERGLSTDFPGDVRSEIQQIQKTAPLVDASVRDMRNMLWCSIDNNDSRDLDQLTVAEKLPDGCVKIYVAIADVDSLVPKGSATDRHAQQNTTSIYTPGRVFPMLPSELSTDLTSLNAKKDRQAVVMEYVVGGDGLIRESDVYRAQVNNHARLAYNSVAAWLDGRAPMPPAAAEVPGMEEQLRMQDQVAQKMKERRHENGSLTIETINPQIKVLDGGSLEIIQDSQNRAQEMIENFMVAANGVTARFLAKHDFPTIMRVVKTPQRWDRIVQLAADKGVKLPNQPDSAALEKFMTGMKVKDPEHFPDLSLSVVKLMGRGEYAVHQPGNQAIGHFGLAVKDYAHSTAPNRRYPDLLTQRLLKAALEGKPCPYSINQLEQLAKQCTEQEKNADKAERQVNKSAVALKLSDKIGQNFEAMITGASDKGTWVRLFNPPAEGRLISGQRGLDVGDRLSVKLTSLNVEKGFIDFVPAGRGGAR